jgi:xanthine dehydrogenase accessory factor
VTVVRREAPVSAHVGDSALVTADGEVVGWVGGAECAQSVAVREAKAAIESGESTLIGLAPDPADVERPGLRAFPMTCHSGGTLELFVEPVVPGPDLVVVGDAPVARAVARLGREVVAGVTVVTGERADLSSAGSETDVEALPATDAEAVADAITGATAVVVASMGQYDELGVEAGLRAGAGYVGLVASDRRRDGVAATVAESLGVDTEDVVAAVTTPAGLDISARSPEEIAVSVLAELVALRRGADDTIRIDARDASTGPWERDAKETPGESGEHDETENTATATVVDPVCGMDVTVDESTPAVEHSGETYHFCGQGCADAFAADPGRYVEAPDGTENTTETEEVTDV